MRAGAKGRSQGQMEGRSQVEEWRCSRAAAAASGVEEWGSGLGHEMP
jgi:hypothetical protein